LRGRDSRQQRRAVGIDAGEPDADDVLHVPTSPAICVRQRRHVRRFPDETTPDLRQLRPAGRLRPGDVLQSADTEHTADDDARLGGSHLHQVRHADVQVAVADDPG